MSKITSYNFEPVVSVTVSMSTVDECRVVGGGYIQSTFPGADGDIRYHMDYDHGNTDQVVTLTVSFLMLY